MHCAADLLKAIGRIRLHKKFVNACSATPRMKPYPKHARKFKRVKSFKPFFKDTASIVRAETPESTTQAFSNHSPQGDGHISGVKGHIYLSCPSQIGRHWKVHPIVD